MWNKFVCCAICYEIIASENEKTAELWIDLCGHSIRQGNRLRFRTEYAFNDELQILEDYGFVITHETDKELWLKMNGCLLDDSYTPCFCLDQENHHGEEEM